MCLSSSMNNRKLSTNTEENSRREADVTWSLSRGNLSLSKGLSLDCLRKWLQKPLLMQLFIRNIFLNTVPQPVAEKKGDLYWHREKAATATVPRMFQNLLISNLHVNMKYMCTLLFYQMRFTFSKKKQVLNTVILVDESLHSMSL